MQEGKKRMEEIFQKHARTVYRYLLSRTANADLAEELTQETFFRAVQNADQYDGSSSVSTWLCGIARNVHLEWIRKNPAAEELPENTAAGQSPEDQLMASLDRVDLLRLIHALPETLKEIMYLRIFGNLSFKEIAEIVGRSENDVRVQYYRARLRLRNEVERNG